MVNLLRKKMETIKQLTITLTLMGNTVNMVIYLLFTEDLPQLLRACVYVHLNFTYFHKSKFM